MKKLALALFLFMTAASLNAVERPPAFRIWRSSALQGGNYTNVLFSTETIIFHTVIGSPTVNAAGDSYFALYHSTGATAFTSDSATRAFVSLNVNPGGVMPGIGAPFDVMGTSQTYFSKQGGAIINILWDYYSVPPNYKNGGAQGTDTQTSGRNP